MQTTLPTKTLGRTGLVVSQLGYGAMEVRGSRIWGGRPIEPSEAGAILNAVLDEGITFIDTANDYGRSEEFIGQFLAPRRGEFILATKCGCTVVHKDEHTDDTPHVWTRDNLFRGLHESLERMKTDYVDVMQLHNPSVEQVESGDLVGALREMQAQGKSALHWHFFDCAAFANIHRKRRFRCLSDSLFGARTRPRKSHSKRRRCGRGRDCARRRGARRTRRRTWQQRSLGRLGARAGWTNC